MSKNNKSKIHTANNLEIAVKGEKELKKIAKMLHGIQIKISRDSK